MNATSVFDQLVAIATPDAPPLDLPLGAAPTALVHSVSIAPRTHCGIPLATRPRITGSTARATCEACAEVRASHGWAL